jgi:hypothetical protein
MAFTLPTFNVSVNVWDGALDPTVDPPDLTLLANVSLGRRIMLFADANCWFNPENGVALNMFIRIMMVPAGTNIKGRWWNFTAGNSQSDWVEVPAGTGAFYKVLDVADMAKGFANEHRVVAFLPYWDKPLPVPLP